MAENERYVAVDYTELSPSTLRALIEEYVTREGTDYGLHEKTLDDKVEDVERQLRSGEAQIFFDLIDERVHLVSKRR